MTIHTKIDKDKLNCLPENTDFPQRITLELTNKCNLNCTFCPRKLMEKKMGFLNTKIAKKLIDEIAEHQTVSLVPFFRGESLLHPDCYEILHYANKKSIGPIQFTTNATYLDKIAAENIIETVDFISFSMDTTDSELYNKTRRDSDYHTVENNIIEFLKIRDKKNCKVPEVQISAVETEQHKPGITDFINFWKNKVDKIRIYTEHSKNGNPGSIDESLPSFNKRMPCHKVFTDMVIYWDGEVALCNHDWTRHLTEDHIANISNCGIKSAWQSLRYQKIRKLHKTGTCNSLIPCNHCDHWKMFYLTKGYLGRTYTFN